MHPMRRNHERFLQHEEKECPHLIALQTCTTDHEEKGTCERKDVARRQSAR